MFGVNIFLCRMLTSQRQTEPLLSQHALQPDTAQAQIPFLPRWQVIHLWNSEIDHG